MQRKEIHIDALIEDLAAAGTDANLQQIEHIADGGMAHVFRALQPSLDRYVVIKQLKRPLSEDPELVNRFRREARCLAAVLHQNVAHVYDFVEGRSGLYILMEHISGIDLSTVLRKLGTLPPRIAAAVAVGITRGLDCLHGHQLVHRDVKPSNIRITTRGDVKLMDLGIVLDVTDTTITRPGILVGSPSYLAPEQILGDPVSAHSDIFLVGICLYEMLSGTRPFKDEGHQTVFHRIRDAKFVPLRKMNRAVPRALEKIVHRCLQREPERRFRSAAHLLRELESFLGPIATAHSHDLLLRFLDQEALLTPTVPFSSADEWREGRSPAGWLRWVAVALIAGAAFVAGLKLADADREPRTPPQYSRPRNIR